MREIPTEVFWQLVNFLIFVAILYFALRKKVKVYFEERELHFKQALIKAEHARKDAEHQKNIIREKLAKLEASSAADHAQAEKDANDLKAKILAEAKELVATMKKESERTADAEIQRAKVELREELLDASIQQAKKTLTEKVGDPDQKRLQDEFVDKIQAVRP